MKLSTIQNMHPFLAPAPAPLKTWRVKPGPRRLVELDPASVSDGAAAAVAAARAGLPAVPDGPKSPAGGRRKGSVRLARLNPELVRRLEEAKIHDGEEQAGSEPILGHRSSPVSPPPLARARSDTAHFLPEPPRGEPRSTLEGPRSWSVSPPDWSPPMPVPARMRGLDRLPLLPNQRGEVPPGPSLTPWRDSSLLRDRARIPGDPLDTLERDRLLEGLGLQQRHARTDLQDVLPLETRKEFAEERQGHLREIEDLRQHAEELTEVVHRLQAERSASRKQHKEELAQCIKEESLRLSALHEERRRAADQQREQEAAAEREALEAAAQKNAEEKVAAQIEARKDAEERLATEAHMRNQAEDKLAAESKGRRASEEKFAAEAKARQAAEEKVAAEAKERQSAEEKFAAEAKARQAAEEKFTAESKARRAADEKAAAEVAARQEAEKKMTAEVTARKAAEEKQLQAEAAAQERLDAAVAAALAKAEESHRAALATAQAEAEAQQELGRIRAEAQFEQRLAAQALEAKAETERLLAAQRTSTSKMSTLKDEVFCRTRAPAEDDEVAALLTQVTGNLRERCSRPAVTADGASRVRARAVRGGSAWASSVEHASKLQAFMAWRMVLTTRRSTGALQAKIFAEEARRNALLKAQKCESDARFTEAEARHREALHRARAELVEAEARHADVLAAQEAQAAQRLASSEADFSAALREALRQQVQRQASSTISSEDLQASIESHSGQLIELAAIRAEAEQQSTSGGDALFGEALRALRERTDARLAEAEARHTETLRVEREQMAARINEVESRVEEEVAARSVVSIREATRRLQELEEGHAEALEAQRIGFQFQMEEELEKKMQEDYDKRMLEARAADEERQKAAQEERHKALSKLEEQ